VAAKGYFEAFKLVKEAVRSAVSGKDAAQTLRDSYPDWYRALFSEAGKAGLLEEHRLAGYRNGRLARFVMNFFLASAGYPWTIVRTARRTVYMAALEKASTGGNIEPFARFILEEMQVDWQKEK